MSRLIHAESDASRVVNYVAFSRCRTLTGIHLLHPFSNKSKTTSKKDRTHQDLSAEMTLLNDWATRTEAFYQRFFAERRVEIQRGRSTCVMGCCGRLARAVPNGEHDEQTWWPDN